MIIKLTNLFKSACLVNTRHIQYAESFVKNEGSRNETIFTNILLSDGDELEVLETPKQIYDIIYGAKEEVKSQVVAPTSPVSKEELKEPSFIDLVKNL